MLNYSVRKIIERDIEYKVMVKFDDKNINKFIENLESVDETWQSEYNLKEVIKKAYPLIQKARKYKVSWDKIAKLLENSCDEDIKISPVTIRQYFLEVSKKSKKTKNRTDLKKDKSKKVDLSSPAIQKEENSNTNTNQSEKETEDSIINHSVDDVKSHFNL